MKVKRYQTRKLLYVLIVLVATLVSCTAQLASGPTSTPVPTSLYVSLLDNPIRGMSSDEIKELETGAGAGFARAAELNGYPGPRHILELQNELGLSENQLAQVEQIYAEMNGQARQLGAEVLKAEAELERAFRNGTMDESSLDAQVSALAETYGDLRLLHLRTHLAAIQLLSQHQLALYNQLRGYAEPHSQDHSGMHNP